VSTALTRPEYPSLGARESPLHLEAAPPCELDGKGAIATERLCLFVETMEAARGGVQPTLVIVSEETVEYGG
jgi:hypothetical protein